MPLLPQPNCQRSSGAKAYRHCCLPASYPAVGWTEAHSATRERRKHRSNTPWNWPAANGTFPLWPPSGKRRVYRFRRDLSKHLDADFHALFWPRAEMLSARQRVLLPREYNGRSQRATLDGRQGPVAGRPELFVRRTRGDCLIVDRRPREFRPPAPTVSATAGRPPVPARRRAS